MIHHSEADVLAATYGDACTVYRPVKRMLPNLETVIRDGLDGEIVMSGVPCALSSLSVGKLQHGEATSDVKTDYLSSPARRWTSGPATRCLSPALGGRTAPSQASRSGSRATIISR